MREDRARLALAGEARLSWAPLQGLAFRRLYATVEAGDA
jgi:hypothetical protein